MLVVGKNAKNRAMPKILAPPISLCIFARMDSPTLFEASIFEEHEPARFESLALRVFRWQAANNPVYGEYLAALGVNPARIDRLDRVPFLPIEFFKSREVVCGQWQAEATFRSSGTTGQITSQHRIKDLRLFRESFVRTFRHFYGDPRSYRVLALLPSYLERDDSSLVFMARALAELSGHPENGFHLYDFDRLAWQIDQLEGRGERVLLLGVTFALWEFAERYPRPLRHTLVMETGGMKGRRPELVREAFHGILRQAFGLEAIHSEYGMTELLSQAYSDGQGIFACPPWMRVMARDPYDPFALRAHGSGGLNVIDLANLHSCSFIETQDLGTVLPDGRFTVDGRFDHSELRGCNLMVAD